jgi:hypothetical protein
LMFLVGVHSDGRFFSVEIPDPSGPRHCGQFPAAAVAEKTLKPATIKAIPATSAKVIRRTSFMFLFLNQFFFAESVADLSPNAYRCETVRTITIPSEIAGVAIITSPTGFFASNSYFGPAFTTNTSPSSLAR